MVTAWPHVGIVPIELWDVLVGGATLFARRDEPTFYTSLVTAVIALRAGTAVREGGARLPATAWDAVALVGGSLDEARARDAFDAAGLALDVVAADPFFAASHAREVLAEIGPVYADAIVINVGQTAIKCVGPTTRSPPTPSCRRLSLRAARRARGAGVGCSDGRVLRCRVVVRAPRAAVRGRERDGEIVLGASTYPTAGEGAGLVREILACAGCASASAGVVNDAILAAWALAQRSPSYTQARLVLTLGLGVGAAVVERANAS